MFICGGACEAIGAGGGWMDGLGRFTYKKIAAVKVAILAYQVGDAAGGLEIGPGGETVHEYWGRQFGRVIDWVYGD